MASAECAVVAGMDTDHPDAQRVLVDAVRRLMRDAATARADEAALVRATQALEEVSALLRPGEQIRRVAFDEDAVRGVRAGARWMMAPYNPMTVPMEISIDGDHAHAELVPGPLLEGPPGLLHGGFAAHLLDALLGALVQVQGRPGYTVRMDLRFLRPTDLNRPIRVEAVMGATEGRKMNATGWITQDGERTVQADALFVQPAPGSPVIE